MAGRDTVFPIKGFLGTNRRDGADLVQDNEFFTLQNLYQAVRGLLYKRSGTTENFNKSSIPLADKILGFHRQFGILGDLPHTLIWCHRPAGTGFVDPATKPTLSDIASLNGGIFNGGAAAAVYVWYSWVGSGRESLVSPSETITPGVATNIVRVAVPTFPTGVRSANVFMATTNVPANAMCVGVIRSTGTTLDVLCYPGPAAAAGDALGSIVAFVTPGGGNLKRGRYYMTAAWVCKTSHNVPKDPPTGADDQYRYVDVELDGSCINVQNVLAAGASTNGATYFYAFIGLRPPTEVPMIFTGIAKTIAAIDYGAPALTTVVITDLPRQSNFMTYPAYDGGAEVSVYNSQMAGTGANAGNNEAAFLMRRDNDGTLKEICYPRLGVFVSHGYDSVDPFTSASYDTLATGFTAGHRSYLLWHSTENPFWASYLGLAFIANGRNLLLQSDGYSVSEIREKAGTVQPGFPAQVVTFKDQLVVICTRNNAPFLGGFTSQNQNQVYGSNALQPYNWSDGGTGSGLRFATIGDPFGDGITTLGVYSYTTNTDGPKSYIALLKKAGVYGLSDIPNSTSGVNASAESLSSRVGCVAPRTFVNTPLGAVFLGTDGDVYLVNGDGEPKRIGTKMQTTLSHLQASDTLGILPSACYHDNHYKLAYPSASTSTNNDAQNWADLRTDVGLPIAWSGPHIGIDPCQQEVFLGFNDNAARYALNAAGSQIYLMDDTSTFQDLGSAIVSKAVWKTSRFGADMHLKRFMSMFLDLYYDSSFSHSVLVEGFAGDNYGSANISLSTGSGTWNSTNWDAGLWGSAEFFPIDAWFSPTNLLGRTFQWALTHSSNAQIILAEADILYQPERRRIVS